MALDMFLQLNGIPGESRDSGFEGAIDVLAWSWGVSNDDGKTVLTQGLSLTKYVDLASVPLLRRTITGDPVDGLLSVRRAGQLPLVVIEVGFTGARVASVSTGGSGGEDRLTENVVLDASRASFRYREQRGDGSVGAIDTVSWDVLRGRLLS